MGKVKLPIRKPATNATNINRIRDGLLASLNDRLAEILIGTEEEKGNAFKVRKPDDWIDGNGTELEELINNRNPVRSNKLSKNLKSDKKHAVNFCDRDAGNSKTNGS